MSKSINASVMDTFTPYSQAAKETIDRLLQDAVANDPKKIVVLDDDPTGIQTVHDISVYTDWSPESIRKGFEEPGKLFYILTNSRSFTVQQTTDVHTEIARTIDAVSRETGKDYLVISRGDSTLRGHYPLETELLKGDRKVDGEILCPYFREGGRFTIDNIHYVKYGDELVPAGETEFARDATFGYRSSDLREYIEEKTGGRCKKDQVLSVSLEQLRALDLEGIADLLMDASDFQKIVVNAVDDYDVKVFCIALYAAMKQGKTFLFRTAAALVKAIANISDKPLLTHDQLITTANDNGGIIVVGSHTAKTTAQLDELKKLPLEFIEMNSDLVLQDGALEQEVSRIVKMCDRLISEGRTAVVYTRRKLLTVPDDTKEKALIRSVQISDAVQSIVHRLSVTPSFVLAKGGITSSDVGTKALQVKRADVLGQIRPGIPVWKTGPESRFPGIPYIIFPGNVGEVSTLREAVEILCAGS